MIRRPPRSTLDRSSAASDVYKRQLFRIDDREHDERAQLGSLLQDLLELALETNARVQPNRHRLAELQRRRADHALGSLAGGVADDHDRLHRSVYITGR